MGFTSYSYTRLPTQVPSGISIIESPHALKETDERLFPASKNRSARIHKKLLKRFGGEFRKVPCCIRMADKIIMHPDLYNEFCKEMQRRSDDQILKSIMGDFHP